MLRRSSTAVAVTAVVAVTTCTGLAWAGSGHGRPGGGAGDAGGEQAGDLQHYATTSAGAYRAALDAYVWGAPLVAMSRTRARLTCLVPENRMINVPRLSTPADRTVVMPNVDTLYSTSWLDLRNGPVSLAVPAMGDRYYVFQFMDMYTNTFANIGTRTTGQGAGTFLVAGPGWHGRVPRGVTLLRSPTPDVWLLGRTLVRGPDDVPNVVRAQQGYVLTPPAPGSPRAGSTVTPQPPRDCANLTSPQDLVSGGLAFYDELGQVMAADPAPGRDRGILRELARAGIRPGRTPSRTLDPAKLDGLTRGLAAGDALVAAQATNAAHPAGGWTTNRDIGTYGVRYITRALVARVGLGANVADESVYYRGQVDAAGARLDGRSSYRVHIAADAFPEHAAMGFWSLTMYDQTHFLVDNPIDRYSLGDRTPGVVRNADGSLDIWISATPPAGHESNWLPAPAAAFDLSLRVYLPSTSVLTETWHPPAITKQ
jgi:hypothetical protein